MNNITYKIILFLLTFSVNTCAQNFPVATLSGAYSHFSYISEKFGGYAISLKQEFGLTRRFSLVPGVSFNSYSRYESFDVDTTRIYIPSPNTRAAWSYNYYRIIRFVSFPLTANYFLARNNSFTISGGMGTVLQYELRDDYYHSYYFLKPDGTWDMGPRYEHYNNTKSNDAAIPDFFMHTAIVTATKTISPKVGLSAHISYMILLNTEFEIRREVYDFALGVFLKSGKNFRKK